MTLFFVASCVFILLVSLLSAILIIKYIKLADKNASYVKYLRKITNVVTSVRYGNLGARIEGDNVESYEKLSEGLNKMFESISDREQMIQEHIKKEKELNNLKADFIATLTHDLKVPIIAQDNTFNLFLNGAFGKITPTQEQALKNLKISNMDLKYLIEVLLETYKMEQAGIEIKKTPDIDIAKLIYETIDLIRPVAQAHEKNIYFSNNLPEGYGAEADVFLIKRVVQNMLLNALSQSVNSDRVDISLYEEGSNFVIKVQDYGCGIEKEEINKIFRKYYSGSSKFTKSSTGLGLYLSNKIVKLHNGKIGVESFCADEAQENLQTGTTFFISVPKA